MDGLGKEMRGAIRPEPMFQRPEGRRPAYRPRSGGAWGVPADQRNGRCYGCAVFRLNVAMIPPLDRHPLPIG